MVLDVIVGGLVGGIVAAAIAAALLMVTKEDEDPVPTAVFASRFLNDEPPAENEVLGFVLLAGYGILAGLVLVALAALGGFHTDLLGAAAFGLLFGVLLWLVTLFWMGVLGILSRMREDEPDDVRQQVLLNLGVHLGLGLLAGLVGALVAGALA